MTQTPHSNLTVRVLTLNDNGQDVDRGSITIHDGEVVAVPADDPFLLRIINAPIMLIDGDVTKDTPEAFLCGLHRHYKSAYLRVTKAVQ